MGGTGDAVAVFGTDQPVQPGRQIKQGGLSFYFESDSVRHICWHGVEIVRGIAWPIRDENWGTLTQQNVRQSELTEADGLEFAVEFSVQDALDIRLGIRASNTGCLRAEIAMTARHDFATNRAGFTILHPIDGLSGSALDLRHADGSVEHTAFPELVRPDQPAKDITGMTYRIGGVSVDISFSGEVFEMEDQRNWTDASFKTYCRPLVYPFTYTIASGETVVQSLELTALGAPNQSASRDSRALIRIGATGRSFPAIAAALEPGWLGAADRGDLLRSAGIRQLQARIGPTANTAYLAAIADLAARLEAPIDIEIVTRSERSIDDELTQAAAALTAAGIAPARVIALPDAYLASHQPSGPWPDGATPQQAVLAARRAFPAAEIGGGVLTNFTEFNRCRPRPEDVDYITHGTTAIVHASDDRSVIETLEALPHVLASGKRLSGGRPYRLGLTAIGMRSNPYGADVVDNPDGVRCTMARNDPRHRGLFGAAWAVGALAAATGAGISALALGAPAGPFSLFAEDATPAPLPLYHVVRFAAGLGGTETWAVTGLPPGIKGFAASTGDGLSMALSNLSDGPVTLVLPSNCHSVRVLDAAALDSAREQPDWLEQPPDRDEQTLILAPFAVAFAGSAHGAVAGR